MSATVERHEFQTEARQLLDLMIHSVYSNREVFLRELLSNCSDALDKRRFEAVKDPALSPGGVEPHILIEADSDEKMLAVHDNGIGMSRDEVQDLIGTIAKSGTSDFLAKLKEKTGDDMPPELIGQFGVGFYSSFMVADRVTLVTRKAGEDGATRWESTGDGTYTLEEAERGEAGTSITLHLKESEDEDDHTDFTDAYTIKNIVKKYSDFVAYPIQMKAEPKEADDSDEAGSKPEESGEEPRLETLNSMKAIWLKEARDVSDEELKEFYKHISHDWSEPLETIRAKIEGTLEYRLLLFIPPAAPFDLFFRDGKSGLQLYVKRVFIMDDCKELVPEYLRFMKGVIDSEDLSLNISREMLQQDKQIERMRRGVVSKVLDTLKKMQSKDLGKYEKFWREFGALIKEGIYTDHDNKDALLDLVLCPSTGDPDRLTTLKDYVERMKDGQNTIYYMTGETREAIERSPHIEGLVDREIEVLLLTDPVDEIWVQSTFEYGGKKLQSAGQGDVDLGSEDKKKENEEERKEKAKTFESLLETLKDKLDEHVKEVRLSNRLTSSAACLVGEGADASPQLEKLMKAMNREMPKTKRVLELNPKHAIMDRLQAIFDEDPASPLLEDYGHLLYGQALLSEGSPLPDPVRFTRLVTGLMVDSA